MRRFLFTAAAAVAALAVGFAQQAPASGVAKKLHTVLANATEGQQVTSPPTYPTQPPPVSPAPPPGYTYAQPTYTYPAPGYTYVAPGYYYAPPVYAPPAYGYYAAPYYGYYGPTIGIGIGYGGWGGYRGGRWR